MGRYFITGGLGGPWKKEKLSKYNEIVDVNYTIDDSDPEHVTATCDKTFDEIKDLYESKKSLRAKICVSENLHMYASPTAVGFHDGEPVVFTFTVTTLMDFNNPTETVSCITFAHSPTEIAIYPRNLADASD